MILSKSLKLAPHYKTNPPAYWHDDFSSGATFQPHVYKYVKNVMTRIGTKSVLDIGCGANLKIKEWDGWNYVGIDYGPNLTSATELYPHHRFLKCDFESITNDFNVPQDMTGCVAVCADVIEHLVNPMPLLNFIHHKLHCGIFSTAVLTSPDKDALARNSGDDRWKVMNGPPMNPHHVREWTFFELYSLCSDLFTIVNAQHTATVIDVDGVEKTFTTLLELLPLNQ